MCVGACLHTAHTPTHARTHTCAPAPATDEDESLDEDESSDEGEDDSDDGGLLRVSHKEPSVTIEDITDQEVCVRRGADGRGGGVSCKGGCSGPGALCRLWHAAVDRARRHTALLPLVGVAGCQGSSCGGKRHG